ncbi:hypothetical protein [Deinococcus hopiensis]|uniref:Uncharacterized protein n=1 Tax=Deinococcus hopiensis KR-140 TaxID=695939 RepID=A0A1W1UT02_9DEIO|nr:hypothetical protein [Deinococcus hopiensis]SMB84176.1 hypothetical protein SAMN00790413_05021 [Deinococcus hopiensis KR-140]
MTRYSIAAGLLMTVLAPASAVRAPSEQNDLNFKMFITSTEQRYKTMNDPDSRVVKIVRGCDPDGSNSVYTCIYGVVVENTQPGKKTTTIDLYEDNSGVRICWITLPRQSFSTQYSIVFKGENWSVYTKTRGKTIDLHDKIECPKD